MNVEEEFQKLRAESLAAQILVTNLCCGLVQLGEPFRSIVAQTFDDADHLAESGAFNLGGAAAQLHLQTFATVLEELRKSVFPSESQPKNAI